MTDTNQIIAGLSQLVDAGRVLTDADSRRHLAEATEAVLKDQFYRCLKSLRALLPREDRLLAAARA